MFKLGSIRKIEVKNFVTYTYAEMFPGPNLNMLIGPNGTGKSTIVAAIILGLGGNPKVVGRGVRASEYVKHNCEEATINIFLQGELEDNFIKITRVITINDKTSWSLNNKKVLAKDVLECIKEFKIQVDNLCQFLPQDRVQDFAKLNQQDLLKQTQVALCRHDLIEKQEALIECRASHKRLTEVIDKGGTKLQEYRDANLRLEGKIENFSKKKKFLSKVEDIDRKIAWMQYDNSHEKMTEAKEDLGKATQIYEKHKSAAKPIEREVQTAKNLVSSLQQSSSNVTRSIRDCENSVQSSMDKIERSNQGINEIEADLSMRIAEIEQQNQEIENAAAKIEEMKVAQRKILEQCGNDQAIQEKVRKITGEVQKFKRHVNDLQNRKEDFIHARQNNTAQMRAYEHERQRLENVKQQRLQYLQRVDRDAYEGVMWLRQHKHLFRGEIFEPIMLELNVLDPSKAIYVENMIPMRDRIAFTCVNKDDMNSLIKYLRDERQLTVNVIHSGEGAAHFQPAVPIEQLKRFGLYTYVQTLFTAPEPIMNYLCKTYHLHNIPIGNADTNHHFQRIPERIRVFFSDNQKYSVSVSKYSGEKSTRQNEIRSDGGLSISVDVLHLERLRAQIDELKIQIDRSEEQIQEFDQQTGLINTQLSKLGEELRHIQSVKQQVQTIETRIVSMQRRIKEMKERSTNVDLIKQQAKNKIKKIVSAMQPVMVELQTTYTKLAQLRTKHSLNSAKIDNARRNAAYLENKSEETRRLVKESEATLNQVKEAYANIKGEAKAALQKAKSMSNNSTPEDPGFEEFRAAFNKLPRDFQQLQEEKRQISAKIDCLNTANDDEMREYEERVQQAEELQERIDRAHVDLSKVTASMTQLQEEWLGPLRLLVGEINQKFAESFERMGCAGEVSVKPGDDDKDFAKYGLCVKVTYRNGEPLQELNNVVQSGGERAVATAIFMLSLQELTPVPFRCVDEINQGMDANNERRIFDLLMETTSRQGMAQYFLITPKLIPNLTYSKSTMVHIVHNGPFVEQDRKWGMSKFCNPQRVSIR